MLLQDNGLPERKSSILSGESRILETYLYPKAEERIERAREVINEHSPSSLVIIDEVMLLCGNPIQMLLYLAQIKPSFVIGIADPTMFTEKSKVLATLANQYKDNIPISAFSFAGDRERTDGQSLVSSRTGVSYPARLVESWQELFTYLKEGNLTNVGLIYAGVTIRHDGGRFTNPDGEETMKILMSHTREHPNGHISVTHTTCSHKSCKDFATSTTRYIRGEEGIFIPDSFGNFTVVIGGVGNEDDVSEVYIPECKAHKQTQNIPEGFVIPEYESCRW